MPADFLDTSALAKHYHVEVGSAEIDRLWNEHGHGLFISRLSVLEMTSVFAQAKGAQASSPRSTLISCDEDSRPTWPRPSDCRVFASWSAITKRLKSFCASTALCGDFERLMRCNWPSASTFTERKQLADSSRLIGIC